MQEIDCYDPRVVRVGFKTVLRILEKWSCSQQQIQKLLKLPENYEQSLQFEQMCLSKEQVERISYILNIHAGLRVAFNNPENIYGFINMVNHNSPFNGNKPIYFICNGELEHFQRLQDHIDSLFD
tara:strand:- start:2502 stop:2876 length:375 start_codon:yes stop_codon:yes gene_type:complete